MRTKGNKKRDWDDLLIPYMSEEGTDLSLLTGLDWQRIKIYHDVRIELSKDYPNTGPMEDETDTIDVREARNDTRAPLFIKALTYVKEAYDRVEILQHLASDYEKRVIRFYAWLTYNWPTSEKHFKKVIYDSDLYETVESYFKILRKYGLTTQEEPYYFLTPEHKRAVKVEGDMLKRSTQLDGSEIQVSILGEL